MARLGELLRAQRERKGITLEAAAVDTRIRDKFITALEEGDYQSLPGAVYTKGFLRNYAEYLDLDPDELVVLYHQERGASEPPRSFEPIRPIMRRNVILTPAVLVPIAVLAGVALFVGYLYYQFVSFAVQPRLEVTDPPGDAIAQDAALTIKGRTVPDGRVTVRVFPGTETIADVRPSRDGSFNTTIQLKPGSNHIEVEVLDAAGKQNRVSRTVILDTVANASEAPKLIVDQPTNSVTVTNTSVLVSGHFGASVSTLKVNNSAVPLNVDGSFQTRLYFPAGQQIVRISAANAGGVTVEEVRTVNVVYTAAVVTVFIHGGDAWVLATVDGVLAPGSGRVFKDGETAVFTGKEVRLRTGNAAVTQVNYNGSFTASLGSSGQVVERVYTSQ